MTMSKFALSLAVCALGTAPLAAQTVQGRVVASGTDDPVPQASVRLLLGERGDSAVATVFTDDEGRFQLAAPFAGPYRLAARRIGFTPVVTSPFDLLPRGGPLEVQLVLAEHAVPLAPLVIVSDRPARMGIRLLASGYYEREKNWGRAGLGQGHFLDREEITRRNAHRVTDAVRMLRGVYVEGVGGRGRVITFRTVRRMNERACVPEVFIDGVPGATGANVDEMVAISDVAAIEVYPGLSQPGQFTRGNLCGVVVIWTGPSP